MIKIGHEVVHPWSRSYGNQFPHAQDQTWICDQDQTWSSPPLVKNQHELIYPWSRFYINWSTHDQSETLFSPWCPFHSHVFHFLLLTFILCYNNYNLFVISWHTMIFFTSRCIIWILWEDVPFLSLLPALTSPFFKWTTQSFPLDIAQWSLPSAGSTWKNGHSLESHWISCTHRFIMFNLISCLIS